MNDMELLEKLKKLEEVSGQDIDSLISLFSKEETSETKYYTTFDNCSRCGGHGSIPLGPGIRGIRRCPDCNGSGRVRWRITGDRK